ncbi:MAG: hypothetical protein KGM97_02380 [Alphaproteobacteria bacterium]|nr:hypothetical protein [Alphaproteobacteria bacterium]MDE2629815.1 hypothetical protein [Alphaproteobacteria bacterium]
MPDDLVAEAILGDEFAGCEQFLGESGLGGYCDDAYGSTNGESGFHGCKTPCH